MLLNCLLAAFGLIMRGPHAGHPSARALPSMLSSASVGGDNETSRAFNIDLASAGIRRELYSRDPAIRDMIARSKQRGGSGNKLSSALVSAKEQAAFVFRVTPAWIDTAFGCFFFIFSTAACQGGVTALQSGGSFTSSAEQDIAGRVLAMLVFAVVQQLAGLPTELWIRWQRMGQPVGPRRLFGAPALVAGVAFGAAFAIPVVALNSVAGLGWLPPPAPLPSASGAVFKLVIAPLSEEIFFRSWLLTSIERAGGTRLAALSASAMLFALYEVPLAEVAAGNSAKLALFEALGGYLALLHQWSGGSLPLAVATHSTFNMLVTMARAAQTGALLPLVASS